MFEQPTIASPSRSAVELTTSVTVHPAQRDITMPSTVVREGTVAGIELRWEGVPADPDARRRRVRAARRRPRHDDAPFRKRF